MAKHIERESEKYEDGSKTVEDTFMKKDGTLFVNTYNITSDEKRHDHAAVDENGEYLGGHSEDERSWNDKKRDFLLSCLSGLTVGELQIIEAKSNNNYIKRSARSLMKFSLSEIELIEKGHSKKLHR